MPWNQADKDKHQATLPFGWDLTYAPDHGWFVRRKGLFDGIRAGGFHAKAQDAVKEAMDKSVVVSYLWPEAWYVDDANSYLRPDALASAAVGKNACPHCKTKNPNDYDDPAYVGMTKPTNGRWIALWKCSKCDKHYVQHDGS